MVEPRPGTDSGDVVVTVDTATATAIPPASSIDSSVECDFPVRLRGYDRARVDAAVDALSTQVSRLSGRISAQERLIGTLQEKLRSARSQLRFHDDRATFVESEVQRVRADAETLLAAARLQADEIEGAARARARSMESEAQQRAVRMIDRVCAEANGILAHAREEAETIVARYDSDLDVSERRMRQLTTIQSEIMQSMRGAMQRFEDGISELGQATPIARSERHPLQVRTRTSLTRSQPTAATTVAAGARAQAPAVEVAVPVATPPSRATQDALEQLSSMLLQDARPEPAATAQST